MMEFYDNYLIGLEESPNEYWRNLQQATISDLFDNTTIRKPVLEEKIPFNQEYQEIEAWVGTVTDAITNTEKDANDYLCLYFEDCNHDVGRGLYYKYDKNYWLVYDGSTELQSISNVKIRRCNNKLKWYDENGELKIYPCILDYTLSATNPKITVNITTVGGRLTIIVQGNKDTHKLKKNQRFIFNGVPYRFDAYNNYMQDDYVSEEVPLLFLDCTIDEIQPNDDLENNIANVGEYVYKIKIKEESFEQSKGFKGKLSAVVTVNGEPTNKNVTWSSSNNNIVNIDKDGNYELLGNDGEFANIIAKIENSNISDSITITIKEIVTIKDDIVIEPIIESLGLYDSVEINANLYKNGVKQDDIVNCTASGLPDDYYDLVSEIDNVFILTNNKPSKTPLTLTFSCGGYSESINIKLESLF